MVVYRQTDRSWVRWVIFVVVFGLAMTITFADVEGRNRNQSTSPDSHDVNPATADNSAEKTVQPTDNPSIGATENVEQPTAIPEPSTLILVGLGLGSAYLVRKRLSHK
jgi:hypothetical protein